MGAIRRLKRLARQVVPSGVVLLYHRVSQLAIDPQLLAVSPHNFAEQLAVLRQLYLPIRLEELQRRSLRSWPRTRLVTLTFDDGYADNLYQARPLLEAADIPATVFVATGQMGKVEEFWWDELERILLSTPQLPERLEITIGAKTYGWPIPSEANRLSWVWNVLAQEIATPRQMAYRELCALVKPLDNQMRQSVLEQLRIWAGVDKIGRSHNRTLTEAEIVELAKDGLVEIGAHTMTHPMLATQSAAIQKEEITVSKQRLEEVLGRSVRTFSYPFGTYNDYTKATVQLVKEAGYHYACSNFPGRVQRCIDWHQIPRFIVRNWDGDEFIGQLEAFLQHNR